MNISITLSGPLRDYYKTTPSLKAETVVLDEGSRVGDLMAYYAISQEKAHFILVNRRRAETGTCLKNGDHVWLIPLAAGG
jgi:molybdopterin converting factor small subunit